MNNARRNSPSFHPVSDEVQNQCEFAAVSFGDRAATFPPSWGQMSDGTPDSYLISSTYDNPEYDYIIEISFPIVTSGLLAVLRVGFGFLFLQSPPLTALARRLI